MEPLGSIVEILGPTLVLIKTETDTSFDVDDILVVFAEVKNDKLAQTHGLNVIQFPKGRVSIVAKQTKSYYIAETFRPMVEGRQIIEKSPSLLSGLFPTEVIKKRVPGEPSATLADVTTEFKVSKQVEVGDKVGRE